MLKNIGKIVLLSVAVLLLVAPAAVRAQEGQGGQALPKLGAGYSYVACYFGTVSKHQWKWGLTPDNSWYSMTGDRKKLSFSKIEVFVTTTPQADIETACARSKARYKIAEPLLAAYSAMTNTGRNFLILSNGACLFSNP
jgi:hypothetical protein